MFLVLTYVDIHIKFVVHIDKYIMSSFEAIALIFFYIITAIYDKKREIIKNMKYIC